MHYNAPLARTKRLVVSIHDLTHILDKTLARTWKSWVYARPMLNLVARKADHIFTLSTYSRDQIVRCLGVAPEKITITYVGVDDQFHPMPAEETRPELLRSLNLDRPYTLFVGNLKPHKNVKTLVRAFSELAKHGNDGDLVIVGDDRLGRPAILAEIEVLGMQDRVKIFHGIETRLLASLYAAAEILVLPSFEEGFGLPVLEAMASGTPVACSRAASLPEVGGDAAEYFDPNSCSELAACLVRILQSPEKRQRMRQLGLARARLFTWRGCAQKHYDVYRQFLC
jgi:alpha-1,3-rhamnosyl/mannosyltransferase